MNELLMVFSQGFIFLGKPDIVSISNRLLDAVKLDIIYVPTPHGLHPVTTMRLLGNLTIDISSCPSAELNDKNIYADYVKLTTGIDLPKTGKLN